MTEKVAEDAFKTKAAFEETVAQIDLSEIIRTASDLNKSYNSNDCLKIVELTQNHESFLDTLAEAPTQKNAKPKIICWIVANHKERYDTMVNALNSGKSVNIFLFKAYLNEDKLGFECLLKPNLVKKAVRNNNTSTKLLQKEYWEKYFEICDELQSLMQISPAPQHFQYIPIGKAGVSILQTVNTKDNYIATELLINNNKDIFAKLFDKKQEIEEELGELDWQSLETNKSSKIRKIHEVNINNKETWEMAITEHIKMAEQFKATFTKYL